MEDYFAKKDPLIRQYFTILSDDFPDFLVGYINTPAMQQQDRISVTSGTCYSKMFDSELPFTSLDHSIAVALIIWHFTKDQKQALSGLFHDISTPVFKHCIDFMNGDHETQESTEDLTETIITDSPDIMRLLSRDRITVPEISNYHIYPVADNDTPMLSADRLEYTFSNGLGVIKKLWNLDEVASIYSKIQICQKADGTDEMTFTDLAVAEKFVNRMSTLSLCYMSDKDRFSMQLIADIMKTMSKHNLITIHDLYTLSEAAVVHKIQNCNIGNISHCFKAWQAASDIKTSSSIVPDKYCLKINAKKRYIDPLVKTKNELIRTSELSPQSKNLITKCLNYSFDRYLYMDFQLKV